VEDRPEQEATDRHELIEEYAEMATGHFQPIEDRKEKSGMFSKAKNLENEGKYQQAIEEYLRILDQNPRDAVTLGRLGWLHAQLESSESALNYYDRALRNDPSNFEIMIQQAVLLMDTGQFDDAQKALIRALEINPDSYEACFRLGELYINIGIYESAVDMLNRAQNLGPPSSVLHLQLGKAHCHIENHDQAIEQFEALLRMEPENEQAYRYLGMVYDKTRDLDKALEMYRKSNETSLSR